MKSEALHAINDTAMDLATISAFHAALLDPIVACGGEVTLSGDELVGMARLFKLLSNHAFSITDELPVVERQLAGVSHE